MGLGEQHKRIGFLFLIGFLPSLSSGLMCYECLSLFCDSPVICKSILEAMERIFGLHRHIIDFDPKDKCPYSIEGNFSVNPEEIDWLSRVKMCPKSDSICLFSPVEVHTIFDGKRDGLDLDHGSTLKSYGHLRGCASRRKILDSGATITVKTEMANESVVYPAQSAGDKNLLEQEQSGPYEITHIHYHEFFVDVNTEESYRCYEDNCNTLEAREPPKRNGGNSIYQYPFLITLFLLTLILR